MQWKLDKNCENFIRAVNTCVGGICNVSMADNEVIKGFYDK